MIKEKEIIEFSNKLIDSHVDSINLNSFYFDIIRGHDFIINNQNGTLVEENFFGSNLEFRVTNKNVTIPISIQLYMNTANHYRIFVYNQKGMLTSINLTNGYEDGIITFKTQLKLASTKMTKDERKNKRDLMIQDIQKAGIDVQDVSTVYYGQYDVNTNTFIDTDSNKFLKYLLTVAIIKGHYMENKGYVIKELNCIVKYI